MIPRIYPSDETDFDNLGIGALGDAISCVVTMERNMPPTLEMEYPVTGKRYEDLVEERIIYCRAEYGGSNQIFRIYSITKPLNGVVTVKAEHIAYYLAKVVIPPCGLGQNATPALVWDKIVTLGYPQDIGFTFTTDIVSTMQSGWITQVPITALDALAGSSGSIIDIWGYGDYTFNNKAITLSADGGRDNGFSVTYGKNLTGVEMTSDMTNVYTGVLPFWNVEYRDGAQILSSNPVIYSSHVNDYVNPMIMIKDFTSYYDRDKDTATNEANIRQAATDYVNHGLNDSLIANLKVDFVALGQFGQYSEYEQLRDVKLYDTVKVYYPLMGINVKTKVVKTQYDVLIDRYASIELGEQEVSLVNVISQIAKRSARK